jgi:hypothetical protein
VTPCAVPGSVQMAIAHMGILLSMAVVPDPTLTAAETQRLQQLMLLVVHPAQSKVKAAMPAVLLIGVWCALQVLSCRQQGRSFTCARCWCEMQQQHAERQ